MEESSTTTSDAADAANAATAPTTTVTKNVVIVGAGPAGLLLTALLLKRNNEEIIHQIDGNTAASAATTKYKITLIDARENFGLLDRYGTELKKHRSWMLALQNHGLEAIRQIPELYNEYVSDIGVKIKNISIFLGEKVISTGVEDEEDITKKYRKEETGELCIVDRNYVCAAIARYIHNKHSDDPYLECRYETQVLYVDHENHQILTRKKNENEMDAAKDENQEGDRNEEGDKESYLKYDLLVGCDGVRSIVREALVRCHFDFEMDIGDIFQTFKAVHVELPKKLDSNTMSIFPNVFPKMTGIGLPERDDNQINITIGVARHEFDSIPTELKSDDPKIVAAFFKENLKAFELVDYNDFAKQWVESRWNRTGMVHCNKYHSIPCKIAIMGDAAHATSPSIGMGMNTALRDAQKFVEILDQCQDNLDETLSEFSKQRVKEGNSLTDLAYYLNCFDTKHQLIEVAHNIIRDYLHNLFPSWVAPHPQSSIGFPKWTLSDNYQLASELGIIPKHRRINDRIRKEYFEKQTGMITTTPRGSMVPLFLPVVILSLSVVISFGILRFSSVDNFSLQE